MKEAHQDPVPSSAPSGDTYPIDRQTFLSTAAKVAEDRAETRFVGTQIEWNLLSRQVEEDVVPAALSASMGIVPYFPLASGMLTGKYKRGQDFPAGSKWCCTDKTTGPITAEWRGNMDDRESSVADIDGWKS